MPNGKVDGGEIALIIGEGGLKKEAEDWMSSKDPQASSLDSFSQLSMLY